MKKIILLFLLYAVLVITVLGQNQGIGYQAILRNAEGDPFVNEKVTVLISLLPSADAGSALYTEFHIAETNDFGLVNLEIGRGVAQDQPFSEVDWSGGSMFIEVSIDEDDGNNFQVVGTRELLAVPYALYAANADQSVQTVSRSGDLITLSNGGGSFTDQVDDADADANNEIQDLQLDGNLLSITGNENATSIDLSAYAGSGSTLTEEEIDAFVANNGYLTSETDGDATNEIQDLELTENMLKVTNNSSATEIDLSAYLDNTDTQLTEAQVDDFVSNNGFLTSEVDGDVTNEIQDLALTGNELKITNNTSATAIDLSAYLDNTDTQLTEAQVDAFANNNGYLTSFTEVDGDATNEIQDLELTGNTLKVTNNSAATEIDLSAYLDNTDTQLTEAQVDAFANNNGYLTSFTEVDGDASNEIQDLSLTGDNLTITNNTSATSIDLSSYKDNTDAQTLSLSGTNLSISGGNSVDLDPVINNSIQLSGDQTAAGVKTFSNGIKLTSITSSGASSASTTPLAMTISSIGSIPTNTGEQGTFMLAIDPSSSDTPRTPEVGETIRVNGKDFVITRITRGPFYWYEQQANGLKIEATDVGATVVKVDAASLGNILVTGTLQLTNGASTINLPNADGSAGQVLATDGSGNVTFQNATVDTKLTESEVDAFANNNGYLTSFTEVDGDATNEIQDLNLTGDNLTITNNASATNIDLSTYKDNTDAQTLSLTGTDLAVSGGNSVDLSALSANSVLLSGTQIISDEKTFSKSIRTDTIQSLEFGRVISGALVNDNVGAENTIRYIDDPNSDVVFSLPTAGDVITFNGKIFTVTSIFRGTVILSSANGDVVDSSDQDARIYNVLANDGNVVIRGKFHVQSSTSTLSFPTSDGASGQVLTTDGSGNLTFQSPTVTEVDGDVTNEIQDLSLTGDNLTITNNTSATTIDLSSYKDNTDAQTLSLSGSQLSISGGNHVDLPEELPTTLGTAGQVLAVNSAADGVEWTTPTTGGGGSATNFITETNSTHTIPSGQPDYFLNFSTINQNATVTFPASPTAGDKVTIAFQGNSGARNIAVANTHSGSFTLNSTTYSFGGLSISAGGSGSIQLIYTGSTWILMNGTISWVPI